MPLLGAHVSTAGGLHTAFDRGVQIGCEAIQIFTKSNRQWNAKPLGEAEITLFRQRAEETGLMVTAHATYLINMASHKPEIWDKSVAALIDEMRRCRQLGIPYLVMHPGAHTGSGVEAGIRRVAAAINHELAQGENGTMLLLEGTAGTGTTLGAEIGHFREIFALLDQPERVGLCFDTCHAIGAGWEIISPEGYQAVMAEIEAKIGLDKVRCFHFNDSNHPLGSHHDRHCHIGYGYVTLDAFRHIVNDARFAGVPMILETPKEDDMQQDVVNLRVLRALRNGADEQVTAELLDSFWEGVDRSEGKDE